MDRRQVLGLTASCLVGAAGCSGLQPGSRSEQPNQDATASPSPTTSPYGSSRLDVEVATARYRVFAKEQRLVDRAIEPAEIVPASELSEPFRSALRAAIDGRYRTEDVPEEVLASIDRFRTNSLGYLFRPYVEFDGTAYEFDPEVPEFVAWLDAVDDQPDPAKTVVQEDLVALDDAVQDLVRTIGVYSTHSPRDEYRISVVPDAVRSFLDEYDYVGDAGGYWRIRTERIDPGPPYTIEVRELTSEDLWGRAVVQDAALSQDLRQFLDAVVTSEKRAPVHHPLRTEHRTETIPDAYFDRFPAVPDDGRDPYANLDGTLYSFRVQEVDRADIPAAVSVTTDPSGNQPSFTVTITPSEAGPKPAFEGAVRVRSKGALPSVLWIETEDDRQLLPSDVYETVRWHPAEDAHPADRRVRNVARDELARDEEIAATYQVPDAVPAGTHRIWGSFGVSWQDVTRDREVPYVEYPFQIVASVPGQ